MRDEDAPVLVVFVLVRRGLGVDCEDWVCDEEGIGTSLDFLGCGRGVGALEREKSNSGSEERMLSSSSYIFVFIFEFNQTIIFCQTYRNECWLRLRVKGVLRLSLPSSPFDLLSKFIILCVESEHV